MPTTTKEPQQEAQVDRATSVSELVRDALEDIQAETGADFDTLLAGALAEVASQMVNGRGATWTANRLIELSCFLCPPPGLEDLRLAMTRPMGRA